MQATPDQALVSECEAFLKTTLHKGADTKTRHAAYTQLRTDIADKIAGKPKPEVHLARLAAEFAIQKAEHAIHGGPRKEEKHEDVWSLFDPKSENYALGDDLRLTGVTGALMAQGRSRRPRRIRRTNIILSLWLHGMNREASQDRIGYVWLIMDPLIQIMVICILPLFLHSEFIYDMAIFPFAVIGACFWLVFRASAFGAMSGGGALKPQLEHPPIRRFDIITARGLHALVNYLVAGICLLGISKFLELTGGPESLPVFVLCFGVSWVMGISYGTISNSLIQLYPGIRRINIYSLRFIGLMSALFYTPEQLPEAIANVIWYNPLLHIVQLARSSWFLNYNSPDVSVTYIFFWAISLVTLALICLTIDEKRPDTVRG
jgi:capsular polysaccharide transport system permease protein